MTLRSTNNLREVRRKLRQHAAQAQRAVKRAPAEAAPHIKGMLVVGIRRGVYDTPAGAYQRTGALLEQADAYPLPGAPGVAEVAVVGGAQHTSYVEFGRKGQGGLKEREARVRAEALGDKAAPLYLGRSGAAWTVANPAVTRATVYGAALMGRQLQARLRVLWAGLR